LVGLTDDNRGNGERTASSSVILSGQAGELTSLVDDFKTGFFYKR
jgi:hypothetical protein